MTGVQLAVTAGYGAASQGTIFIVTRGYLPAVIPPTPPAPTTTTPGITGLAETKGSTGGYTVPRPFYRPLDQIFSEWIPFQVPEEEDEETEEEKKKREQEEFAAKAKKKLMAQIAEEDELLLRLYG